MQNFSKILKDWYSQNKRDLPWRHTKNPYEIWLSEIILQQTRVDQGLPYFQKFVKTFPTVKDLAQASEEEVLALWKGLGYYSRGRNLLKAAKQVIADFGGLFPKNYENLIQLKGVGEYSAAAIASFSNQEFIPVVDGNVYRVLSRIFNISTPIDSSQGKKEFKELAYNLLDKSNPDIHNQAIMEFGAIQCSPKKPNCEICPFIFNCESKANNSVLELPVKSKKTKKRDRFFVFKVMEKDGKYALEQRNEKDIWANLHQFPLIELPKENTKSESDILASLNVKSEKKIIPFKKHVLSHQNIFSWFVFIKPDNKDYQWLTKEEIQSKGIPVLIDQFIEKHL